MDKDITVALISAAASMIGSYSLVNWRLQALERKVDSHNSYAEKFSQSSKDIALIQKDISYIKEKLGGKV